MSHSAIDLCNNPKTKEQKLARARRLIPEWTVYDDEVAALARRVAASSARTNGAVSSSSSSSSASDDIERDEASNEFAAFGSRADELQQAVQQNQEREEAVHADEAATAAGRVKDEL